MLVRFYESPEPETLAEGENSSAGVDENAHEEPYPAGVVLDTGSMIIIYHPHGFVLDWSWIRCVINVCELL